MTVAGLASSLANVVQEHGWSRQRMEAFVIFVSVCAKRKKQLSAPHLLHFLTLLNNNYIFSIFFDFRFPPPPFFCNKPHIHSPPVRPPAQHPARACVPVVLRSVLDYPRSYTMLCACCNERSNAWARGSRAMPFRCRTVSQRRQQ